MIYTYIAWFFIYSFFGWLWEVCVSLVRTKKLVNRGFFFGPITPIYGVSVVLLVYLLEKRNFSVFLIFLFGGILITAVELVTGFLMEKIFHTRWWDYSQFRFNFHGYIALEVSVVWGLFSVLVLKVIQPFVARTVALVPERILHPLVMAVVACFAADMCLTTVRMVKFTHLLEKAEKLASELKQAVGEELVYVKEEGKIKQQEVKNALSERYEEQINAITRKFRRWRTANPGVRSARFPHPIEPLKKKLSDQ